MNVMSQRREGRKKRENQISAECWVQSEVKQKQTKKQTYTALVRAVAS